MAGVDLEIFRFDYDLTFNALLMNADGTIYHTYGGRTWEDAQSHLSESAFVRVLEETLREHATYQQKPNPPKKRAARTIEDLPAAKKRIAAGQKADCYHCHTVHDFMTEGLRDEKRFDLSSAFRWPDPIQIGVKLEREAQTVVADVLEDSAAAKVDLRAGDRITSMATKRVLTFGDVQRVLENASPEATTLELTWMRGEAELRSALKLAANWKVPTPLVFSWRPSKWPLTPKPGFGGPRLTPSELETAKLEQDAFAFRISYFVTWGPSAETGRNAKQAGLREGDVVIAVGGKRDFESSDHFHSWFRLTRKAGEKVPVEVLRAGERLKLELTVL